MVQEATIALWRTRERVLPLPKLQQAALVWRIAHNAVVDCLRRTEDTQALREDYDEAAEDNSLVRELHEQIALLDEPNRTIVRMQLEGYSYEEIGEELGMSVKNVSVRLVRIKEELRKKRLQERARQEEEREVIRQYQALQIALFSEYEEK